MDEHPTQQPPPSARAELNHLLKAIAARMAVLGAMSGALVFIATITAAALAVFAADRWTLFPSAMRFVVTAAFIVGAITLLYLRVVVVLLRPPDARAAAKTIERKFPALGDFTLSAAELALVESPKSSAPSEELVGMTVEEAAARSRAIDPKEALPARAIAKHIAAALCGMAVWSLVACIFPEDVGAFFARFANPFATISYPSRTRIVAISAPNILALGAAFKAEAVVAGTLPEEVAFHVKPAGGSERAIYASGAKGRYNLTLEGVREDFDFYVAAGDATSRERFVRVVERPNVASIAADVTYPAYTGMGTLNIASGNIKALVGSSVKLKTAFNKEIVSASLSFADGRTLGGNMADDKRSAEFSFDVADSSSYRIILRDSYGFETEDAPTYQVIPEADAPPAVTLNRPDRNLTAVEDAVVPLAASAADDYGVTAVILHYTITRAGAASMERKVALAEEAQARKNASASSDWRLKDAGVKPGDEVSYYVEALDNLPKTPQASRSEPRTITIVTVSQKLAEIEEMTRQVQLNLATMARKQQEARDAIQSAAEGAAQ